MKEFFTSRFSTIHDYLVTQKMPLTGWDNLFSWKYWTESYIPPTTIYSLASIVFVILLCLALMFWRRHLKQLSRKAPVYAAPLDQIASLMVFIVVLFVAYAFFRAQQISYLSSRLVLLASILVIVIWLIVIGYFLKRVIPNKRHSYLEKERFFRYLPKSKS